ncbi:MAG: sodium:calcium antiporter [Synechococcus sp. BS307-5m-G38]|nr:sodium:calcium antiporter [Synechococcus sp. BS307-5m-G38]
MSETVVQKNSGLVPLLLPILVGVAALASIEFSSVMAWLLVQPTATVLTGLALLSGVVLLLSKSVATQADRVSELIGQPYGTLVLTAAVMTIELALVASTMLTGESNPTLARDSMFSVVMIALTGVTGLCNVVAALRRGTLCADGKVDKTQMAAPNLLGALTYFDLISTMCVLALVIPNFSRSTTQANFSTPVNVVLSFVAIGVYAVFLTAQMGRYSNLFIERDSLVVEVETDTEAEEDANALPLWKAAVLLVVGLLVVCLIAESMGQLIETGITDLGLPTSLAGVLVAMLILAPEALNAVQAASHGEVQRSINTLYGSVVATVSLTVPAVLVLGGITNTNVILGLEPFEMVVLALTLILSYPHARLTGIEGMMKLVIFLFWILLQVA